MSMPELDTMEWMVLGTLIATLVAAIFAFLQWRLLRSRKTENVALDQKYTQYRFDELPVLVSETRGIPPLQQLTEGMELNAKKRNLAEELYKIGLEQFNHYVNNRDGIIEKSRLEMESLANHLSESEISLAEGVARSLATVTDQKEREAAQKQYELFSLQCQFYADHKRTEIDIERRNARDSLRNIPRTDYTAVKSRIASGTVRLSELPVSWQEIRTLNDEMERPRLSGKPPKREFVHVKFLMAGNKSLEDKRAERDGDWIISNKHKVLVPYMEPAIECEFRSPDNPPVLTGKRVVVYTQDPDTEWDTEFWRQGGYLDQTYLRAKSETLPKQLWRAYRLRLLNRAAFILGSLLLIADIVLLAMKYL